MKRTVILLFFIFSLQIAFSQEFEMIRHQVKLGETVRMISKKYKVEPSEIYKLNKFAIDGISQGMILQIMAPKKEAPEETTQAYNPESAQTSTTESAQNPEESTSSTTTTVRKVTTITKKKTHTDDQGIALQEPPEAGSITSESRAKSVSHTVGKGETLFSIAKRYGVSVDDIKSQNAGLQGKGLQMGQIIRIVTQSDSGIVEKVPDNVVQNNVSSKENTVPSSDTGNTQVMHTVVKGETLYSLSKKYEVSVEAIQMQNEQALKKGLQVGQVLVIGIRK